MKNRSKAGNDFQDWIEEWVLKNNAGAVVHNQKAVSKVVKIRNLMTGMLEDRWISQRNDIFGSVDLIWVSPSGYLTFIQATLDTNLKRKSEALRQVPWCYKRESYSVEIWVKRAPGRIDIFRLTGPGKGDIVKAYEIIRGARVGF